MIRTIRAVGVVVPARDEEEQLGGCLRALEAAVAALARVRPDVTVRVVVALDRCVDGSAEVAARFDVQTRVVAHGCVGAARADGVQAALTALPDLPPEAVWLAHTDADTLVPADWLVRHVECAEAGADVVLGTVEPRDLDAPTALAWHAAHTLAEGHPHVHGANLGLRAGTYRAAGGFAPLAVHEDVDLVARARAAGATCLATDLLRVRTSGRRTGRTPAGFAAYLAALPTSGDPLG